MNSTETHAAIRGSTVSSKLSIWAGEVRPDSWKIQMHKSMQFELLLLDNNTHRSGNPKQSPLPGFLKKYG